VRRKHRQSRICFEQRAKEVIDGVACAVERQAVRHVEREAVDVRCGGANKVHRRQSLIRGNEGSDYARHRFNSGSTWNFRECKSRARMVSAKTKTQSWVRLVAVPLSVP